MKHTILRLDDVQATYDFAHIRSGLFYDGNNALADVDNGTPVNVGVLLDGERELHKLTAASDTTKLVGIVSTPELDSTALVNTSDLSEFYNKAGRACRVHLLHDGDQFSLSAEGFVTVPTLNGTVGITNGKWDSAAQTALLTCDEISVVGGVTMYLLTVSADKLNQ